jgi:hypothetical protein
MDARRLSSVSQAYGVTEQLQYKFFKGRAMREQCIGSRQHFFMSL